MDVATIKRIGKEDRDYLEHGSARHAATLGLVKAKSGEGYKGWEMEDVTMYGPSANDKFLLQVLMQKVNELKNAPKFPQDKDRGKANYAQSMWKPSKDKNVRGIV